MPEGEVIAAPLLDLFATAQVGAHLPFAPATVGLAARSRAIAVNAQLADHVSRLDTAALDAPVEAWGQSVRRAVLGILAHNSYHTAEIITVRHMQGWWLAET